MTHGRTYGCYRGFQVVLHHGIRCSFLNSVARLFARVLARSLVIRAEVGEVQHAEQ